jgi:hypothetical protein
MSKKSRRLKQSIDNRYTTDTALHVLAFQTCSKWQNQKSTKIYFEKCIVCMILVNKYMIKTYSIHQLKYKKIYLIQIISKKFKFKWVNLWVVNWWLILKAFWKLINYCRFLNVWILQKYLCYYSFQKIKLSIMKIHGLGFELTTLLAFPC